METNNLNNSSKKDKNRERVVLNALKSFVALGIENSTIEDIATLSGVNTRTIYRYFDSKVDLVFEAALLFWDKITTYVVDELNKTLNNSSNLSGIDMIRVVINRYMDLYFKFKYELIFIQEAEVYLKRCNKNDLIVSKPPRDYEDNVGPLRTAISVGIKDGSIKDSPNLKYLYYNTYDSIVGLLEKMAIDNKNISDEDAKKRLSLFSDTIVNMYKEIH